MMQTNWITVLMFFISWLVSPRKNGFAGNIEIKQISNDMEMPKYYYLKLLHN